MIEARAIAARLIALVVLGACAGACNGDEFTPSLTLEQALAADWDDLDPLLVTSMPEQTPGGRAIVFLHGYGNSGARYVELARQLDDGETRIFLPTAVLPHPAGVGGMWWEFIDEDWPRPWSDDPASNEGWPRSRQLEKARAAILALIAEIRRRYAPESVLLAGHSQGAMLALDVAAALEEPVDRLALFAGYVLIDSVPNIEQPRSRRPEVLIVHGRQDEVVDFGRALRMRRLLEASGFPVTLRPHDGGHAMDQRMTRELLSFAGVPAGRPAGSDGTVGTGAAAP